MAKNRLGKAAGAVIQREIVTAVMRDRESFSSVATEVLTCMALISLHDEFGFGKQRLLRFQDKLESQAECLIDGYVSTDDLKLLAEELRTKIENYK